MRSFGCTLRQWAIVRGDPSTAYEKCAVRRWVEQRRNATLRGISWELSLWDWWLIWQRSGKWTLRGKGVADLYCMARFGDVGPYALGNVEITSNAQNSRDAFRREKPRAKRRQRTNHQAAPA